MAAGPTIHQEVGRRAASAITVRFRVSPDERDARGVRLQKVLARAGVASRRAAEELMLQGRVAVNGEIVRELGTRVDPESDRIEVDGEVVVRAPIRWVVLNKRRGTVTTAHDPGGRPTVYDGLPEELDGLPYVGRLDADTEGLLLLTNDGDVAHRLLHPSGEVEREYLAGVAGVPSSSALRRLRQGVPLEDGPARARSARVVTSEPGGSVLELVLVEGRKREVRRMCDAVGHPVRWLRRVRFGPLQLGELGPGEWRELTEEEVGALRERSRSDPRR